MPNQARIRLRTDKSPALLNGDILAISDNGKGVSNMKWLLALLVGIALTASAADISGNWKATAEGPQGAIERTFTFKVDGDKLTGKTHSEMLGDANITDGKINGDEFSFTLKANFNGNEMTLNYKGKVSGNELKMESSFGDQKINWTAKRTS